MDLLNHENHIPWVTYQAKAWLDGYLQKNMTVFEWGSGGSTLYFSKHVERVLSVEHNTEWHETVIAALKYEKIENCDCFLIPPQQHVLVRFLPYGPHMYVSRTFEEHKCLFFKEYVRKIDEYANESFDLVVVDGRSRVACLCHAIKKIKKGGFLLLDNSERALYQSVMNRLTRFYRKDYFGNGPRLSEEWQTTIWKIT